MNIGPHGEKLTLWVGAMRYYLGRQSYAVHDFCDMLVKEWNDLDMMTRSILIRDIEEAFDRDDRARTQGLQVKPLGMDQDRRCWEQVRKLWTNTNFKEQ